MNKVSSGLCASGPCSVQPAVEERIRDASTCLSFELIDLYSYRHCRGCLSRSSKMSDIWLNIPASTLLGIGSYCLNLGLRALVALIEPDGSPPSSSCLSLGIIIVIMTLD